MYLVCFVCPQDGINSSSYYYEQFDRLMNLKSVYFTLNQKLFLFFSADGEHLGLVLEFSLPSSAFSSMALREMLKMGLEIPYEEHQLDRSLKRPSPLAANGIISNQPQIQKTNENPCRITAPTPETSNFFLGIRPTSAISELSETSLLRKINLESGTLDKQTSMDSLVEKPIPCPPSTSGQLKENTLEMTDTIQNLQPATNKSSEEPQVEDEPTANVQPALITEHSLEEPGISRTRSSTLIESCVDEPAKKKIKTDPDAKPSKFKSIIYMYLPSGEED
jgi:hypothetical protein